MSTRAFSKTGCLLIIFFVFLILPQSIEITPAPETVQAQAFVQAEQTVVTGGPASSKAPSEKPTVKTEVRARAQSATAAKEPAPAAVKTDQKNKEPGKSLSSRSSGAPMVKGSNYFAEKVKQALDLLQSKAPYFAGKVAAYIRSIEESDHSGVQVETGVFYLGQATVNSQGSLWLASVLVHDAYHVELYRQGKNYSGKEGESACIGRQKQVLQQLGAPPEYLTYLDKTLDSAYWEVPFAQRNW